MILPFYGLLILIVEGVCLWAVGVHTDQPLRWSYVWEAIWLGLVAAAVLSLILTKQWATRAVVALSIFSIGIWLYTTSTTFEIWSQQSALTMSISFLPGMIWIAFWVWLSLAVRAEFKRRRWMAASA